MTMPPSDQHPGDGLPASGEVLTLDNWRATVGSLCQRLIVERGKVTICITGRTGSGKSTLGRAIRKKGLPGISPRWIAVLDDGVLSVKMLGIFNRRVRNRSDERDDLLPFHRYLKGKRMVVVVSTEPETRLTRCDVVLRLRCSDEERLERLIQRNADGDVRFQKSGAALDEIKIAADHQFTLHTG